MNIYCIYGTRWLYTSVCPLVVNSHTIYDEDVNPLTPGNTQL